MKLFYANGTIAIASAIALEEAGLAHELVRVDFKTAEQTKPEYLRINPKGRVPALSLPDDSILTETGAILEYIAAKATDTPLVPKTPEQAAHMRSVMYFLASTMHVAHAHKMRGTRWADDPSSHADMAAKVPQTMQACAAYVEAECFQGDFVCGEVFSIADPYLYVTCTWLSGDGVDVAVLPKLSAFMERMAQRDSVKTVRAKRML